MKYRWIRFLAILLLSSEVNANVLGDMQTFSPNTDGFDFITVHSARPLPQGYFAFSNYINFAKDHLLVYGDINQQNRLDYKDSLIEYDFGFSYGFSDKLQFSFQAPVLVDHSSEEQNGIRVDITKGIHSYRPGFKWTLDDTKDPHWAVLGSVDIPNVSNNPYTGTDAKPIYNLEGVYRWKRKSLIQAFNAGVRFRNPGERPADAYMFPLKNQMTLSYGLSDDFSSTARWVFEAFSSYPLDKSPYKNATDASSLDLLLALKHRWYKNLNMDWGFTVEPLVKTLSPTYRVFAGFVYYWKPASQSSLPSVESASIKPGFIVQPAEKVVKVNETVQFYAEGSQPISSCRLVSGPGFIDEHTCEFVAGEEPGVSQFEFTNELGQKAFATIETKQDQAVSALSLEQKDLQVYTGSSVQVQPKGGRAPYRYAIEKGSTGDITSDGLYMAPLTPGNARVRVTDQRGQKAYAMIQVIEVPKADKEVALESLEFVSGKADLTKQSQGGFNGNIKVLRDMQIKKIIVEGHTDSVGSAEYNLKLSRNRAKTVRVRLAKELGLDPSQVEFVGFGKSKPLVSNATAQGRQKNRRVVLKVYYSK